jgi:hypothetical protein
METAPSLKTLLPIYESTRKGQTFLQTTWRQIFGLLMEPKVQWCYFLCRNATCELRIATSVCARCETWLCKERRIFWRKFWDAVVPHNKNYQSVESSLATNWMKSVLGLDIFLKAPQTPWTGDMGLISEVSTYVLEEHVTSIFMVEE